jgi:hypothetical protein
MLYIKTARLLSINICYIELINKICLNYKYIRLNIMQVRGDTSGGTFISLGEILVLLSIENLNISWVSIQ